MSDITNINDHMGLTCDHCGSANWALLRSLKIECQKCGELLRDGYWDCHNSKPAKAVEVSVSDAANEEQPKGGDDERD